MKKYFALIPLCICVVSQAQTKQGTIIYERKVDVHRHIEDEQMKAMVPQFQTGKYELLFKDSIIIYKSVKEEEAPDPFDGGGGGGNFVIKIAGPGDNATEYRNFSNRKFFEQTELEDKKYVIDDTIHLPAWKLSDETKNISGHICKKATSKSERGENVTAWYAEDIPVPAGPGSFCGLPGAVLMVDVDNASVVYTVLDIQSSLDTKELKEPGDGKHITRADFMKKMDELFGPPDEKGRRIIRN